jgi:hypothetical protein
MDTFSLLNIICLYAHVQIKLVRHFLVEVYYALNDHIPLLKISEDDHAAQFRFQT